MDGHCFGVIILGCMCIFSYAFVKLFKVPFPLVYDYVWYVDVSPSLTCTFFTFLNCWLIDVRYLSPRAQMINHTYRHRASQCTGVYVLYTRKRFHLNQNVVYLNKNCDFGASMRAFLYPYWIFFGPMIIINKDWVEEKSLYLPTWWECKSGCHLHKNENLQQQNCDTESPHDSQTSVFKGSLHTRIRTN